MEKRLVFNEAEAVTFHLQGSVITFTGTPVGAEAMTQEKEAVAISR